MSEASLIQIDRRLFDDGATFNILELSELVDFQPRRVYTIDSGSVSIERGGHAHLNQTQLICAIRGRCTIGITAPDGLEASFGLNCSEGMALIIPPNNWIEFSAEPDTVLLCIASQSYRDLITVHSKSQFLLP